MYRLHLYVIVNILNIIFPSEDYKKKVNQQCRKYAIDLHCDMLWFYSVIIRDHLNPSYRLKKTSHSNC